MVNRSGNANALHLLDFEILTWVTSALEAGRHGAIHLITDSLGLRFFNNSGLAWIYDEILPILDDLPPTIHPGIFWDAGKSFALRHVRTPCVMVDYDAILWRPLRPSASVMALHEEPRTWSFYASNREQFSRFGFEEEGWDWEVNPVNTGLLYFADNRVPREMANRSLAMMNAYSAWYADLPPDAQTVPIPQNRATLFAGQRLLAMTARRLGQDVQLVGKLQPDGLTLARNQAVTHLWISKALYRCCPDARTAYVNHLIQHLNQNHPRSREILHEWGLHQPREVDPQDCVDFRKLPDTDLRRKGLRRFKQVVGDVEVEDAHVAVRRPARPGMFVLPGEQVHPRVGAGFELLPAEAAFFDMRGDESDE